jgi:hypothetical protein
MEEYILTSLFQEEKGKEKRKGVSAGTYEITFLASCEKLRPEWKPSDNAYNM